MAISAVTAEKRTAFVYAGAAVLIMVVGIRTILQTSDEGFTPITYITMSALLLEFLLLLMYSFTIFARAGASSESHAGAGSTELTPLLTKFESVLDANEATTEKISALVSVMNDQKVDLKNTASEIASLRGSLETIVGGEINRRVKEQLEEILSAAISIKR